MSAVYVLPAQYIQYNAMQHTQESHGQVNDTYVITTNLNSLKLALYRTEEVVLSTIIKFKFK